MSDDISGFSLHIIGLGLMGGSLAMALRDKVEHISADDVDEHVLDSALQRGVIDAKGGIENADLVIVAVPANRVVGVIQSLHLRPKSIVVDIASTKTLVCNALDQLPDDIIAIGGHPMCGLAENGFENATPTLYHGARFVLCHTQRSSEKAGKLIENLVDAIGAVPLWMERERHDYLTAITSHLPHLLNFALMRLAAEISENEQDLFDLAAGGFDGATRLSRTNASMITGMFQTNASNIRAVAAQMREQLDFLESLFDDSNALNSELGEIVEARRKYSTRYGERTYR